MFTKTCTVCNQSFETHKNEADTCYSCHLTRLRDGGCPEEGDFNTATILSGRLSPQEEREFWQELSQIDHSDVPDRFTRNDDGEYTHCLRCGAPPYVDCDCD